MSGTLPLSDRGAAILAAFARNKTPPAVKAREHRGLTDRGDELTHSLTDHPRHDDPSRSANY